MMEVDQPKLNRWTPQGLCAVTKIQETGKNSPRLSEILHNIFTYFTLKLIGKCQYLHEMCLYLVNFVLEISAKVKSNIVPNAGSVISQCSLSHALWLISFSFNFEKSCRPSEHGAPFRLAVTPPVPYHLYLVPKQQLLPGGSWKPPWDRHTNILSMRCLWQ